MLDTPHRRRPRRRPRIARRARLVTVLAVSAALAASPAGPAAADSHASTDPADAAAGWLAGQLVDGERLQIEFDGVAYDAPGLTADAIFALAAVGVAGDRIDAATDWLETQADTYAGAGDDVTSGAIGKLLLVAATTGRDARTFGGLDLVAEIEAVEVAVADPDDPEALPGRFRDVSDFGDFSTPLTQSLVLLGLHRTPDVAPSEQAVEVLIDQQCADGGFSQRYLVEDADCVSAVDTTAYAVQALAALGEDAAVTSAVAWLETQISSAGSFGSADGQNTNSTGLAAAALAIADGDPAVVAAARDFIVTVQDGCDGTEPGAIPFNAAERGNVALSTAQALPGLVGVGLGSVDASTASSTVPQLTCEQPPEGADDPDAEEPDAGTPDAGTPDADVEEVTQDDGEEADTPRPTRVEAGDGVSGASDTGVPGGSLAGLAILLGAALFGAVLLALGARSATGRRGPA